MSSDIRKDSEWLKQYGHVYDGQWVALHDGVLYHKAETLKELTYLIDDRNDVVVYRVQRYSPLTLGEETFVTCPACGESFTGQACADLNLVEKLNDVKVALAEESNAEEVLRKIRDIVHKAPTRI